MIDREKCKGCPLETYDPVDDILYGDEPRYMIVTEAPARYLATRRRLLSNGAGKVLSESLDSLGYDKADFVFVPQIRCVFDPETLHNKVKAQIQKQCRAHLVDAIHHYRPDVILPLGTDASKQVMGRAVKITKVRGIPVHNEEHDAVVLPLLHPGYVAMYPQHHGAFAADCETFARLTDAGLDIEAAARPADSGYTFIDDLQFLVDAKPEVLVFDTETTGLSYFHKGTHNVRDYNPAIHGKEFDPSAAILTMQFCIEPGTAYMLCWDHPERPMSMRKKHKVREQLVELLCNPDTTVIGQNAKFDSNFVFECLGIRYPIGGDTLMLAALIDENAISKSQNAMVKQYVPSHAGYDDNFNATYDKGRMWEVPLDAMLQYGCGDVDTCLMLYDVFMDMVSRDAKLLAHYNYVSLPGINSFADIEVHGTHIDLEALRSFERLMEEAVEEEYMGLLEQVPKSIKRKHIDKGLKFSRGDFVRDILFDHPDGFRLTPTVFTASTAKLPEHLRVPSVSSKDHLPYFYDACPFTLELAEYVKDERILGTSVRGFQKKYIHDGVVRPTYSLWTTVTGRTASENPNGQNYIKRGPRAKAYREVFVAVPGYVVVEADYSQAELRIVADMANEPTMLEVYRSGGDIHVTTALIVLGITIDQFHLLPKDEQKLARQKAKAVNFGFVYGMGWRKFIGYAKTQYGVEFTEREAQRIREAYFQLYAMLQPWHEAMRQFASQHLMVRSYSGRIRHLPMIRSEDEGVQQEAGRQAINSPVQGFASDLGLIAVSRLQADIEPKYLQPIAFVHDALYCYAPEKYALWAAETLKHYMETNPLEEMFGRRMRVPILADVTIGHSFGDTHELPGFTLAKDFDPSVLWDAANEKGLLLPKQYAPPRYGARVTPQYGDFRAMLRAA